MRDITNALLLLHPADEWDVPGEHEGGQQGNFEFITGAWMRKQILASAKGVAVDLFGWDMKEIWLPLVKDGDLMDAIAETIFRPIARGFLPEEYRAIMVGGRQVPLSKYLKEGVRPVVIGNAWRRLLARGLLREGHKEVMAFFQEDARVQQFVAAKDGASNCYHVIAALAEEVRQAVGQPDRGVGEAGGTQLIEDEHVCIMALDLRNAFNCLSRRAI